MGQRRKTPVPRLGAPTQEGPIADEDGAEVEVVVEAEVVVVEATWLDLPERRPQRMPDDIRKRTKGREQIIIDETSVPGRWPVVAFLADTADQPDDSTEFIIISSLLLYKALTTSLNARGYIAFNRAQC